jgi:hypothetical protein
MRGPGEALRPERQRARASRQQSRPCRGRRRVRRAGEAGCSRRCARRPRRCRNLHPPPRPHLVLRDDLLQLLGDAGRQAALHEGVLLAPLQQRQRGVVQAGDQLIQGLRHGVLVAWGGCEWVRVCGGGWGCGWGCGWGGGAGAGGGGGGGGGIGEGEVKVALKSGLIEACARRAGARL